jgi:hypothetical protein
MVTTLLEPVTINVNVSLKDARMEPKLCIGQHMLLKPFTEHKNIKFRLMCLMNLQGPAVEKYFLVKCY